MLPKLQYDDDALIHQTRTITHNHITLQRIGYKKKLDTDIRRRETGYRHTQHKHNKPRSKQALTKNIPAARLWSFWVFRLVTFKVE